MAANRVYRRVLVLYPADFRRRYGDELVALFDDLVADRGVRAAVTRTAMDLMVTVPRYRLEHLMSEHRANLTLLSLIVAIAAIVPVVLVSGGWPVSLVLLAIAAALFSTQRSRLGRSLRPADGGRRRRLLAGAGIALIFCVLTVVVYLIDIGDDQVTDGALIAYNALGFLSFVSAVILSIAGLRTAKPPPPELQAA